VSNLRPRQVKAIQDITDAYLQGYNSPVLVAPTGMGKTHTAAVIIRRSIAKGKTVWFLAHLKQILKDTSERLSVEGIPHGWIAAGTNPDRRQGVQMVMIQTIVRRLELFTPPDLIIVDEAHLAVSKSYQDVFAWSKSCPKFYEPKGTRLLHLTATPVRLDGRGMGEVADKLILTCSTQDLIDEGLLANIKYYAPAPPSLIGVKSSMGDYSQNELSEVMDKPKITGNAVSEYRKVAHGRPCIAFCVSIKHAENVRDEFTSQGYRAVMVSGNSSDEERNEALVGLNTGKIDVVCNCALWVAGVDAPRVSCIILLAPTQSLVKYLQSIGRGLRMADGKTDCVILDHAGNLQRHGNPAELREWTLSPAKNKKTASKNEVSLKTCPECSASAVSLAPNCVCGHVFAPVEREIEIVEGTLSEIDLTALHKQRRREQGAARSLSDLIAFGKSKGYGAGWAHKVYASRQKKGTAL